MGNVFETKNISVLSGEYLVDVWGCTMTIVDFYKVVNKKKKVLELRKVKSKIVEGDGMVGSSIPTNELDEREAFNKILSVRPSKRAFENGAYRGKTAVSDRPHTFEPYNGKSYSFNHLD